MKKTKCLEAIENLALEARVNKLNYKNARNMLDDMDIEAIELRRKYNALKKEKGEIYSPNRLPLKKNPTAPNTRTVITPRRAYKLQGVSPEPSDPALVTS